MSEILLEPEQIAMRKESLLRLEWDKITLYLSHFATFEHTKEILKSLSPWDLPKSSEFYRNTTQEMVLLFEKGLKPLLENFNLESFETVLARGALLSPMGLYHISTVLKLASTLQAFAKGREMEEKTQPNLVEIFKGLKPHHALYQKLLKSVNDQNEILPSASPELATAHRNCANARRKITENLEQILKSSVVKNAIQDSTWMLRDGRYVLPVRTDRKNDVEGIARGLSQTGSTVFIEPKVLAVEQAALEKALLEIQIEEYKIIKLLSEDCYLECENILNSVKTLTLIDEIMARSQFASTLSANPCVYGEKTLSEQTFGENFKFSFQNARHPLFILERKACVPNTIELSQSQILVLSGPNAGGKTVVLKTVGVFVLMAECGLFLPCEKAQGIEYKNIFVLLGDRQNREEDLSTFSGHLAQIKKIMNFCDEKTLILLDEGFVGTDPAVGVALARAVLEYFAEKNATVIITTHFSSLKTLASGDSRFTNASMEFEAKNLCPTYKLLNGIPGQSYALELCERMGINNHIISEARKYYGTEAQRMENMLKELQEQKFSIMEELHSQKVISSQLQGELAKIQEEQASLHEIKESLVESYRTKLTKRFNAFSNRLEIRERQLAKQLQSESSSRNEIGMDPAPAQTVTPAKAGAQETIVIDRNDKLKRGDKLSSFEDLAKLKIENFPRTLQNTQNAVDKFRPPKQMTNRALIDEAQESLSVLNKSFDNIDEDLNDEIAEILKINKESKQKAQKINANLQIQNKNQKPANFWKVGMRVKTEKFREVGHVLKSADSKGQVECQFGPIKIKIFHSQLITIADAALQSTAMSSRDAPTGAPMSSRGLTAGSTKQIKNVKSKTNNIINPDIPQVLPHAGNTLDLRGKTVDESLSRLELTLDKMWRSEISQMVIIHGHGFGKIKEAVRKYLETTSYELSFRPGRQGEGGDGVTVVEFDN